MSFFNHQKNFVVVIIPMRLGSTRLHEKMTAPIGSLSLSQRSLGRALEIFKDQPNVHVVAAVDSPALKEHVLKAHPKANVVITDAEIGSGTDRVSVAHGIYLDQKKLDSKLCVGVINLQGDIPFVGTAGLLTVVDYYFKSTPSDLEKVGMTTLSQDFPPEMDYQDFAAVKVITDKWGRAIYFSRHAIPHSKISALDFQKSTGEFPVGQLHIGVYGYTPNILAKLCSHVPTELELAEGLEQLRAQWLGIEILVLPVEVAKNESYRGIDTKNDLDWAQKFCKEA